MTPTAKTRRIPNYPCYTTVTYIFDLPETVVQVAAEQGKAVEENHYPERHGAPEHWIVVCRWFKDGVHYTAQSGHTLAPTLADAEKTGVDASPVS